MPPRFWHVFPSFGAAGTQLRLVAIINALGDRFSHSVIALDGCTEAASRINVSRGVEIVSAPKDRGLFTSPFALYQIIRRRRPDLLLTYNWGAMHAVMAAGPSRLCPILHNECGLGADEADRLKVRRVIARRLLLRFVQGTIVTSRALWRVAHERYRVPLEKLTWIRTGVDTERFYPRRSPEWRRRLGAGDSTVVLGYAGGLRPEKNLPMLLKAFAESAVPEARLALLGDGPCQRQLEALAAALGISRQVVFAGHSDDVPAFMGALDVFVMSSATEQTSNALLEAMASGLPVLATDVGDTAELFDPGYPSMVVARGDVTAYGRSLRRLVCEPALRAELGAVNRRRVLDRFSFDNMVSQYGALFDSAVKKVRNAR